MILDKLKAKFSKPSNLSKKIEELGLSDRTYYCLRRAQIATVGDLVELSWLQLRGCRGMVRRSCDEVEKALEGLGLGLRKGDK